METDGTTETTNTLLAGEIKLGVTSSTPTFCAYSGLLDFKGNPISDIRIVLATYDDAFQIMCPKNSDIKTIQDLKGKRVSLNTMGGGGYLTSVLLLGALGIDAANDIRPYYLTMSESASAVQEGSLDAFIYIGGPGASVGLEMAASNSGLKIISLSEEEIQTIMAEVPVLSPKQISVGTYPGVDYEIRTVGGATSLISTEAVPTEEVYEALKILCEHHDEFVSTNSQAAFSTAENTIISFPKGSIPLHSGAEKYFRELGLIK
jgi:TRAP transporter TAXI family solute receptor